MKRASFLFLLIIMSITLVPLSVFAANVGQSLSAPEVGWKRFEDREAAIKYTFDIFQADDSRYYNGTITRNNSATIGGGIEFKFIGTKIRFISYGQSWASSDVEIEIDGVKESFSIKKSEPIFKLLAYEKTGLTSGLHTVKIYHQTEESLYIDAIDIDADGNLIHPDAYPEPPLNLSAIGEVTQNSLTWDEVINSDYYKISRSESSGGPYATVAEAVYGTSYTDIGVINGQTYFYIVTAVNAGGESTPSNEASATPLAPPPTGRAILTITLINGFDKEYDLSMDEVNAFINWYDAKDVGSGPAKYAFTKTWNMGPFKSRIEYVIFDKILTFNVDEYIPSEEAVQ